MAAEPTDVGPLYGGNRPALDSDRRLVLNLLHAARADQRLAEWDYQFRVDQTHLARTFDDLIPITRDLMARRG